MAMYNPELYGCKIDGSKGIGGGMFFSLNKTNAYDNYSTMGGEIQLWTENGDGIGNGTGWYVNMNVSGKVNGQYQIFYSFQDYIVQSMPAGMLIRLHRFNNIKIPHNWDGSQQVVIWLQIIAPGETTYEGVYITFKEQISSWVNAFNCDTISRYAWLTSAPDFTDIDNPTIYFNNPTGHANAGIHAGIYDTNGVNAYAAYRQIDNPLGSSYTFNLTDAERATIKAAAENNGGSVPVSFYLTTYQPDKTEYSILKRTAILAGDPPQLDITLYDTDENAQSAVGNNTKIVKGMNYVYYEINATPDDGATIKSYIAKCGDKTLTTQSGYFENVESGDFTFSATDSRGRTKTETKSLTVIDYFKPTINQEVELELSGETEAKATLKINGTFFNQNFGNKPNQIKVSLKHTMPNGEYTDWIDIQKDLIVEIYYDGNKYRAELTITLSDYQQAYTFQCAVADTLGSYATTSEYTTRLIPVFDWSETDFNFNVPVKVNGDLTITGNLNVEGEGGTGDAVIETGTEAMGTNGTWYWSKWKSGKAECYGVRNFGNMGISTAWGGVYYSNVFNQALPSIFSEAPMVSINLQGNSTGSAWIAKSSMPTATDSGNFVVVRGSSGTLSQVYINFNVIGRWK